LCLLCFLCSWPCILPLMSKRPDWLKVRIPGGDNYQEVRRILLQYKDKGVDLADANQELVRLLRSR